MPIYISRGRFTSGAIKGMLAKPEDAPGDWTCSTGHRSLVRSKNPKRAALSFARR